MTSVDGDKNIEADLHGSEQMWRSLIENSPDHIMLLGLDMKIQYINNTVSDIDKADVIGKHVNDFVLADYQNLARQKFQDVLRTRTATHFKTKYLTADGKTEFFDVRLSPVMQDGEVVSVVSSSNNVTEYEVANLAKLALLSDACRMAKVGGWELDPETHQISWTDESYRIHEVPLDQDPALLGSAGYCHVDDRPVLDAAQQRALEFGEPYDIEFRLVTAKGNERWIRSICKPVISDGLAVKLTGTIQDISKLKRDEEELHQYAHIVSSSTDMLALLDCNFIYLAANDAYASAFGKTTKEVVGQSAADLYGATFFDSVIKSHGHRCLAGENVRHQDWINFQVGGRRYMDVQFAPYCPKGDEIKGFLVAGRDITVREQLHSQLVQAQKMESIGQLAGGVAHDFNNMLGIILGIAELSLGRKDLSGPVLADLKEIHDVAERSADLTRQLLAFARKQTIVPQALDLNETMTGMLNMLRRLIGENIDLTWHPGDKVWPVHMDPTQIDQILANLCTNARDAIDNVGEVRIETRNASFDEAFCADNPGFNAGQYVQLSVSDNGHGMDEATLSKIYEPFFSTRDLQRGTGLGLATVYGIVMQNNGFIDVVSEPGQGATFNVYLPRHIGKVSLPPGQNAVEEPGCSDATILLVEDEPELLRLTTVMLKRNGYTVIAAGSPSEAISLVKSHGGAIDLLLTDVVMPEMNGRELADNLLAMLPTIKTLFMSGYTADVLADKGVLSEETHFMPKPFSLKDVVKHVEAALAGESIHSQAIS